MHNAEEWNELHHLLIMESLGGNSLWSDRFLGYHVAIASAAASPRLVRERSTSRLRRRRDPATSQPLDTAVPPPRRYYWFLNGVFFCSPRIAYQFMELLEAHAVDT